MVGARALDLGCGPGTLTLPLAEVTGEVLAVDPAAEMLDQGRRLAAERGVRNIRWVQGDAACLPGLGLPPLGLVVMAKSFHWMNRDQVLIDLDVLTTEKAGVVIVSAGPPGTTPLPEWAEVIEEVRVTYLGSTRRAGRGVYPQPTEPYRDTLARSPFNTVASAAWDETVVRTLDELLGLQYSNSYTAPAMLGERRKAFEEDLRQALLTHEPAGRYEETIRTEALIATR
ncbi:class I SAM-dependent methyltransferase [Streptomyces lydicus]|uniref:class I SAM-dependent methyltransferase n=1 Tax=Streptomyces lydicus TaxID=47763 RepID=UPI00240E6A15|nr:class I SAM-dependent methyltransferase [Streptomyces lydicus]